MTPGRARCPPAGLPAKRATLAFVVAREAKYGRDPVTQFAGDAAGRRDAHRDAWRLICLSQGTLNHPMFRIGMRDACPQGGFR
ncbi:hypothetical protein WJ25_07170 [Burkholderia thailandensis]|nr:hypothetical protein WJ25_07170 [Burkholderia thailandensis]